MIDSIMKMFVKKPEKIFKTRWGVHLHGEWVLFENKEVAVGMARGSSKPIVPKTVEVLMK